MEERTAQDATRHDVTAAFEHGEELWDASVAEFYEALHDCLDALLYDGYARGFRQQAPRVIDSSIQPSPGAVERIAWRKTHRLTVTD